MCGPRTHSTWPAALLSDCIVHRPPTPGSCFCGSDCGFTLLETFPVMFKSGASKLFSKRAKFDHVKSGQQALSPFHRKTCTQMNCYATIFIVSIIFIFLRFWAETLLCGGFRAHIRFQLIKINTYWQIRSIAYPYPLPQFQCSFVLGNLRVERVEEQSVWTLASNKRSQEHQRWWKRWTWKSGAAIF